jgi:hypothetical protein
MKRRARILRLAGVEVADHLVEFREEAIEA